MGFVGRHTTFTKERLDRCVANQIWKEKFKDVKVEGLTSRSSDRIPILLSIAEVSSINVNRAKKFNFEASWLRDEKCELVVTGGWLGQESSTNPMKKVQQLLHSCSGILNKWAKIKDSNSGKEIERLIVKIKKLQGNDRPKNVEEIRELQKKVMVLLVQEDVK
ncbi:hypothetical protein F2P56_007659 [Juglans regia]|uniref:Uncharacterized protein n=1 Tax=Juglans regia TaxID=51240 RepID=A0A833Y469_JUGRE|nr:hypothetical protein F2P56_007659 [Juglans regia]